MPMVLRIAGLVFMEKSNLGTVIELTSQAQR